MTKGFRKGDVSAIPDRSTAIELLEGRHPPRTMDSFERLLWWLFAGSAGARTRALVLYAIKDQPRNAQQLSLALGLDYTTVRHHLRVLEANRLIVSEGEKYGRVYFVSEGMEAHWSILESLLRKMSGKGSGSDKGSAKRAV
ncbi:MAG: winged helix-turn-helix transcriptional regulator [Nitrososphaerota archaeon]|nr:winged helix-turn-helix transcriptional regulator [Nitrososphaerota archaeon]